MLAATLLLKVDRARGALFHLGKISEPVSLHVGSKMAINRIAAAAALVRAGAIIEVDSGEYHCFLPKGGSGKQSSGFVSPVLRVLYVDINVV